MTISTTTNKASFSGSGTTGPFTFVFPFEDDSEISVFTTLNNVITDLSAAQYTLTGAGTGTGGSVTTTTAVPSGTTLIVMRTLPLTQTTDIENYAAYYAETHEATFDRITKQIQQLQEQINRCLRMPKNFTADQELSSSRYSCYLGFDSAGNVYYSTGITSATAANTVAIVTTSYELPASGEVVLFNGGESDCVLTPQSGDTIMGQSSYTLSVYNECVHLVRIGTDWKKIGG